MWRRLILATAFCAGGCGGTEVVHDADSCVTSISSAVGWKDDGTGALVDITGADANLEIVVDLSARRLTSLSASFVAAAGHSQLPERLPWFSLSSAETSDGPVDAIGTAFAKPANVSEYENDGSAVLDLVATPWSPDSKHTYSIRFVGEGGAGAKPGMVLTGWHCMY